MLKTNDNNPMLASPLKVTFQILREIKYPSIDNTIKHIVPITKLL